MSFKNSYNNFRSQIQWRTTWIHLAMIARSHSGLLSHQCRCLTRTYTNYSLQEMMTLHRPYVQDFGHFGPDATPSTFPHPFLQPKPFLLLQLLHLHLHLWTLHPIGMKHYLLSSAQMLWRHYSKRTTQVKYLMLTRPRQFDFVVHQQKVKQSDQVHPYPTSPQWTSVLSHDRNQIIQTTSKWNSTTLTTMLGWHPRHGHYSCSLLSWLVRQNLYSASKCLRPLWYVSSTSFQGIWCQDRWTYLCPTRPGIGFASCGCPGIL